MQRFFEYLVLAPYMALYVPLVAVFLVIGTAATPAWMAVSLVLRLVEARQPS